MSRVLRSRTSLLATMTVVCVMISASCSAGQEPVDDVSTGSTETSSGQAVPESDELREAMGGVIDYDTYLAGFQRYSACMSAAGHGLIIHDADGLLVDYVVPEAAVSSGTDERCYTREFGPLDAAWQVANEDTSEWAEILRGCLQERGIAPAPTLVEMEEQRTTAGLGPEECLGE